MYCITVASIKSKLELVTIQNGSELSHCHYEEKLFKCEILESRAGGA